MSARWFQNKKSIWFALCLSLGSCELRNIVESDIPGKYRAGYVRTGEFEENGWEILELFPDGKFLQEIHLNGRVYSGNGTWKFDKKNKYIHFRGIKEGILWDNENNPKIGGSPEGRTLGNPVSKTINGGIHIMLTEEIDYIKLAK